MLEPYPKDDGFSANWEAMGVGAPTISSLAKLCAEAVGKDPIEADDALEGLSDEAKAILFAAKDSGVVEVKGVNTAFGAPSRFLAIYVDIDDERTIVFRNRAQPEITIRFFDGFRELCRRGLVMHHLFHDFSLTTPGFAAARRVSADEVEQAMEHATEFGLE